MWTQIYWRRVRKYWTGSLRRNAVSEEGGPGQQIWLQILTCSQWISADRQNDKLQIYNLSQIGTDRKWLQDILLSDIETDADEDSDEDDYIREMLKDHVEEKKVRAKYYQNPHVSVTWVEYLGVCACAVCIAYVRMNFNLSFAWIHVIN